MIFDVEDQLREDMALGPACELALIDSAYRQNR